MPRTHKDLDVWKNSIGFATSIYKITKSFPKEESYGLISQIRRASVSIPSNIAEGAVRWIYWRYCATHTDHIVPV